MTPEDLAGIPPARLPFPVTRAQAPAIECRAEGDGRPVMSGHFSTFGDWYEVDSWLEGQFLESIRPGAFRKTIAESRDQMKVLYDHGQDPTLGNQVLGPIERLEEDRIGPAYDVPLFDGIPPLLVSGLRAGVYGSSFRFTVEKDKWDYEPEVSDRNPRGIPERSITEARVYEFGPVTFPANPNATVGVRSTTDDFYRRSRDSDQFGALLRSAQLARTPLVRDEGAAAPPTEPPVATPEEPAEQSTPGADEAETPVPAPSRRKPRPISAEDFLAQLREE